MRNCALPLYLSSTDDSEYDSDGILHPQTSLTLSIEKPPSEPHFTAKPDPKVDERYSQLQELIAIYDSIVKKSPSSSLKTRSLDNFFSAIACSLNIKQGSCNKTSKKENHKKNTKYENLVATFQELARSSLSLTQIASLNNIIAGLQNYLNKDYQSIISDLAEMIKKPECKKPHSRRTTNRGEERRVKSDRSRSPKKNTKKRTRPQSSESPETTKIRKKNEEISKVSIHPPTKLEDILKLGFCPQNSMKESKKADLNEKLLVTVKLAGSEVLVNNFSYIENENVKKLPVSTKNTEISELIIENVSNDQNWYKNTKSSNLRLINRYLSEEKHQFQVKTPKKEIPPKVKRLTKRRTLSKSGKVEIPDSRFEYDQKRLRTQYPIEAIDEISESEVIEDFGKRDSELLVGKSQSRLKVQKRAAKRVIRRGVSSALGRGEGKVGRINSCMIRRRVRSKSEQKNTKPGVSKSVGCLKEEMCPKKYPQITSKSVIMPTKPAPSSSLRKTRENSGKKSLEGKKSKAVPSKMVLQVKPKTETPKPVENSVLYLSSDDIPQSSSIEFLFSESDAPSRADSDQLALGSSETVNPKMPSSSPTSDHLIQNQSSISDERSDCLERINDSPIAILPPTNCSEITSAPMELIHSDSFLINFPPLRVTRSKLKAFFKANSEVKFYPGRLTENKVEETPLVKFVLTPKQYQEAGIPANQVVVVSRPTKDDVEPQGKENNQEDEINQIDKFIQELSKWNKGKKKENQKSTPQHSTQRKSLTNRSYRLWQGSRSLSNRKVLHECEKRKLVDLNKKINEKAGTNSKSAKTKEQSTPKGSFTKAKPEGLVGDGLRKPNIQKEKPTAEIMKYKLKGLSVNPSEITPELMEAVKATINRAPDLTGKEEILAAIEEGFSKNQQEIKIIGEAEAGTGMKKLNTLKIKIQRKKPPSPKGNTLRMCQSSSGTTKPQNQKPKCPVKVYIETPTVYFDAQETIEQELEMKNDSKNPQPKGAPNLNLEQMGENEELNIDPTFISSLSDLLPEDVYPVIMTNSHDCEKLKKVLEVIKTKSRDLMLKIESSVWMEVLMFLEEISQVIEDENLENSKPFFQRINSLNQTRMNNFGKGYSAFDELKDERSKQTFLDILKKQLYLLTQKISFRRSSTTEDSEQFPSSFSLPDLKKTKITQNEEIEAQNLKRKLRQYVYVLQELLKAEKAQETHPELKIEDMQKKIVEKLKVMEELGDTSDGRLKDSLMAMKTLLELLKNYRDKTGSSSDGETSKKGGNFGFSEIMNCLITAWNAQMPITYIKSDFCHG